MKLKSVKKKKETEQTVRKNEYNIKDYEEAFRYIRARYCHEKKKIIFIMYTVRKLRNLAKLKYVFNFLTEKFMLSACLLLQKGLVMNKTTINSLKKGFNVFKLQEFDKFLKTPDNKKIQNNFKEDDKI